jgi:hypothetical protein
VTIGLFLKRLFFLLQPQGDTHLKLTLLSAAAVLLVYGSLSAATLQVGPGHPYPAPCAAIAAAAPGDTIQIDAAGVYTGDVCTWSTGNLTLVGVNGRPHIDAGGKNSVGKGIWVIDGNNNVVNNIEFSGATVPDGNGAGIRFEGLNLTVSHCYFHNNQDGILTNNPQAGEVVIEYSEFGYNGTGTGFTHNVYIGQMAKFTFRFNYSHHAYSGQLVKTRAAQNFILYNRLSTEDGTASYELQIPNGGLTYVIGNIIQQGVNSQNGGMLSYLDEGSTPFQSDWSLYVVNNTFVSDRAALFIHDPNTNPIAAVIRNNIFSGPGTLWDQTIAVASNNLLNTVNPQFVNPAAYDYHLQAGSPAIDAGVAPGVGGGQSLTPIYEYSHPVIGLTRAINGPLDIGAFEYGVPSGGTVGVAGGSLLTLSDVSLGASAVVSGATLSGAVQLSAPAPTGGAVVTLASSNTAAAPVPASVTVPAGATTAAFSITAGAVATSVPVTITAAFAGAGRTAAVTVVPHLAISGVSAAGLTASSATIAWTTNIPGSSQVRFGPTSTTLSSPLNSALVTSHTVQLSGLAPATTYRYSVTSAAPLNNQATSADFTFRTLPTPPPPAIRYSVQAPATAVSGQLITVTWTAPAGHAANDFIGLYSASAGYWFAATGSATSGSFTVPVPATSGPLFFRYILGNVWTVAAQTPPISVTSP